MVIWHQDVSASDLLRGLMVGLRFTGLAIGEYGLFFVRRVEKPSARECGGRSATTFKPPAASVCGGWRREEDAMEIPSAVVYAAQDRFKTLTEQAREIRDELRALGEHRKSLRDRYEGVQSQTLEVAQWLDAIYEHDDDDEDSYVFRFNQEAKEQPHED